MPLDSVTLGANTTFAFIRAVTGWADLEQGSNQVGFGGAIDPAVWNQAYAAVLTIAGGDDETIDLTSFTNLAGEAVSLTAVLGIVAKVVPVVAADDDTEVTIGPGASNGLEWPAGANPITLLANESFAKLGDAAGAGFAVDGTHKTLKVENTGADDATVTVVIIGKA